MFNLNFLCNNFEEMLDCFCLFLRQVYFSYSDGNLLAAIFLYSSGILNFFVRIVPFAFRWIGKVPIHERALHPAGLHLNNFFTHPTLAKPACPVRFPKAQNRKMGTESNLHSSPFGMKIDQDKSKQRDVNKITIFSWPEIVNFSSFWMRSQDCRYVFK